MHESSHLSLEKYEVLFHLLTGYYLLLGTFLEKFNYYFGFSDLLERYQKEISSSEFNSCLKILKKEREKAELEKQIDIRKEGVNKAESLAKRLNIFSGWNARDKKIGRLITKIKRAIKTHQREEKIIPYHISKDCGQSLFFQFFKFYYAVSGLFCFNILFLHGMMEPWRKELSLEMVIIIQIGITAYVIYRVLFKRFTTKFLGLDNPWLLIIIITSVFFITDFTPLHCFKSVFYFSFSGIGELNFMDVQILVAVILAFSPIIIHNICLYRINNSCKKVLLIKDVVIIGFVNQLPTPKRDRIKPFTNQ